MHVNEVVASDKYDHCLCWSEPLWDFRSL